MVTESRNCEQCGVLFTPRREHARFCSARCRVAWNRLNASGTPAEGGALDWTITAMAETIDRLLRARGLDRPHAFAVISEAVWWVTMVDATLVRYHPDAYDAVLAAHEAAERLAIEGTFGGLRFVRNQMGYYLDHADFIQPGRGAMTMMRSPARRTSSAITPAPSIAEFACPEVRIRWHPLSNTSSSASKASTRHANGVLALVLSIFFSRTSLAFR